MPSQIHSQISQIIHDDGLSKKIDEQYSNDAAIEAAQISIQPKNSARCA